VRLLVTLLPHRGRPCRWPLASRPLGQFRHSVLTRISVKNLQVCFRRLALAVLAIAIAASQSAHAQTLTVLYSFTGAADGGYPESGVTVDSAGNVYGTTEEGGSGNFNCSGCGVVFKVSPAGDENVLHSFSGNLDGAFPLYGTLFRDPAGNLYGTTSAGGANGGGTVFRLSPNGKQISIAFPNGTGPGFSAAGLTPDDAGNAYGTTQFRGTGCAPYGCGTVFEVSHTGKMTIVHSFQDGTDGANPIADLVRDSAGNLYGTTLDGGAGGAGTVFKIDSTGKESVLYAFMGGTDGGLPHAGLLRDAAGNLYGTTSDGGVNSGGTIFKVDSAGNHTILYNFCPQFCQDGQTPMGNLARDSAGNIYGTTEYGGVEDAGVVFELDTNGEETVLYNFCSVGDCSDGDVPVSGVTRDSKGNLYGTTLYGGSVGYGVVFKLTP
jgi:uncharacterized repeat protein (TIGR03803 family)